MDTYGTKTTERGDQTYLLLGNATSAVFSGPDHVDEAALAAELLNDALCFTYATVEVAEECHA